MSLSLPIRLWGTDGMFISYYQLFYLYLSLCIRLGANQIIISAADYSQAPDNLSLFMEAERMAGVSSENQLQISHLGNRPEQKYHRINAYTHKPSKQQILTLAVFLIQFSIHCVFLIRPIFYIDQPILYFLWAFYLISIVVVGVDYLILTCGDPVDRLVKDPSLVSEWKIQENNFTVNVIPLKLQNARLASNKIKNPYEIKQCKACNKKVKIASYHCWTCRRCVEGMDHHCKYLNNCIGGKNYASFFRLLSFASLYMCLGMTIGVWAFVRGNSDQRVNELTFTKWMSLVFVLLNLIALVVVQILLWFHCYISCCLRMTTVEYIYRDTESNNEEISNNSAQNMNEAK